MLQLSKCLCGVLSASLALCFGSILVGGTPLLHAECDLPEQEVEVEEDPKVDREDVEGSLFGERQVTAIPVLRLRLDAIFQRKLDAAKSRWRLNDGQIEKLEFVGDKSIRRLFEQIEEHRQRLKTARQRVDQRTDDNLLNRETSDIRSRVRTGPFEDDSMFAKVLRQILTDEQTSQDKERRSASRPEKISLRNAVHLERVGRIQREVYGIDWTRDGTQVALIDSQKKVEILAFPEMRVVREIPSHFNTLNLRFGPAENLFAIAADRGKALIVDFAAETEVRLDSGRTHHVEFDATGSLLVTSGFGTSVRLWSVPRGELIREIAVDDVLGFLTPAFSPDGAILAVGHRRGTIRLFESSTGRLLHVLSGRNLMHLRFNPAGTLLAVVGNGAKMVLWDTKEGVVKRETQGFGNDLWSVHWSPDGTLLATGGEHTPVTLWNAADLSIVNELECPEMVYDVSFSRDGTHLVVAGSPRVRAADKFVDIWAVP